jgi:hypothetical protein
MGIIKIIKRTNQSSKLIIISIIICISIIIFFIIYKNMTTYEYFKNDNDDQYTGIITKWDNSNGFYSQLLFKLNQYIYCKKYNINFAFAHENWSYTYKDGWTDYFENVTLSFPTSSSNSISKFKTKLLKIGGCCTILEQFPLRDYVEIIPEFYRHNNITRNNINLNIQKLGLNEKQYGAVYIRRGDKLVNEIEFVPSSKFVDILLSKYPDCNVIFVQTDDYNSYLEIEKYIKDMKLPVKVYTLCSPTNFGSK